MQPKHCSGVIRLDWFGGVPPLPLSFRMKKRKNDIEDVSRALDLGWDLRAEYRPFR